VKDAETGNQPSPNDILELAARVYEGLSVNDIKEIEEMAGSEPSSAATSPDSLALLRSRPRRAAHLGAGLGRQVGLKPAALVRVFKCVLHQRPCISEQALDQTEEVPPEPPRIDHDVIHFFLVTADQDGKIEWLALMDRAQLHEVRWIPTHGFHQGQVVALGHEQGQASKPWHHSQQPVLEVTWPVSDATLFEGHRQAG
jgi:hypothetical protein